MRIGAIRSTLGLAVEDRAIDAAEVQTARGGAVLRRRARFEFPAELTWEKPDEVGAALGKFLRAQGFKARSAVVGLPGKWVLARPQSVPPADEATMIALLRLAVEREFHGDARDWAFDAAGRSSPTAKRTVLLVGTPRRRIDAVRAAMGKAGLDIAAITGTTLALASATLGKTKGVHALLHLSRCGASLVIEQDGQVHTWERLAVPATPAAAEDGAAPWATMLASEVGRVLAVALPRVGQPASSLVVWNSAGVPQSQLTAVGPAVSLPVTINPKLESLDVSSAGETAPGSVAAAAVGSAGLNGSPPAGDFLRPRLALAPRRRITRERALVGAVVVALLAAVGFMVWDYYSRRFEVESLTKQVAQLKPSLQTAKASVERMKTIDGWYDKRPPMLECLRDLTENFPAQPGQVWATNLSIRDDMSGTLTGKAVNGEAVTKVQNNLSSSKRFTGVRLINQQKLDAGGSGVSFTMSFNYLRPE